MLRAEGPENDILTREELCRYLRLDLRGEQLDRLIRRGEFPRGVPYGQAGKLLVWYREDALAFRWLRMRLAGGPPPEGEPPAPAEGPEK